MRDENKAPHPGCNRSPALSRPEARGEGNKPAAFHSALASPCNLDQFARNASRLRRQVTQMDYASYLQLSRILSAQAPESARRGTPAHDEMLFIIIHQSYELWFKQIIHEIGLIDGIFGEDSVDEADLGRAVHAAERIVRIQRHLVAQIDILETMTPMDFLEFRNMLVPASGFQSEQFRIIEARLGLSRARRLSFDGHTFDTRLPEDARTRVKAEEEKRTVLAALDAWLSRTPFVEMGGFTFREAYGAALDAMLKGDIAMIAAHPQLSAQEKQVQTAALEKSRAILDALIDDARYAAIRAQGGFVMSRRALQAALFIFLYRDEPALQLPFRLLHAFMDLDEQMALWRLRHALMVSRMIGSKVGTGGSSGAQYLRATADEHRVFNDLFALTTFLIPRSAMPKLPDDVRRAMRYRFEA